MQGRDNKKRSREALEGSPSKRTKLTHSSSNNDAPISDTASLNSQVSHLLLSILETMLLLQLLQAQQRQPHYQLQQIYTLLLEQQNSALLPLLAQTTTSTAMIQTLLPPLPQAQSVVPLQNSQPMLQLPEPTEPATAGDVDSKAEEEVEVTLRRSSP